MVQNQNSSTLPGFVGELTSKMHKDSYYRQSYLSLSDHELLPQFAGCMGPEVCKDPDVLFCHCIRMNGHMCCFPG